MKLVVNSLQQEKQRESYFDLVKSVFGLDFRAVYNAGFLENSFIPYTYYDGEKAVSSVAVLINYFLIEGETKRYIQISTVCTDPEYRGQGLSGKLMDYVLAEWINDCDCIYLMANDSVVDYYPMFGFKQSQEYTYSKQIPGKPASFRMLDLTSDKDVSLLIRKHTELNPYSQVNLNPGIDIMMFHCINFLKNCIYYIQEYDAIVIAVMEQGELFVYDIYADGTTEMDEILASITLGEEVAVTFGFTPVDTMECHVELSKEEDSTFFVMADMDCVLNTQKVTLPYLSRA